MSLFVNEAKVAEQAVGRIFERIDLLIGRFNESEQRELLGFILQNLAEGAARGAVKEYYAGKSKAS